jgi:hypothetical protein
VLFTTYEVFVIASISFIAGVVLRHIVESWGN